MVIYVPVNSKKLSNFVEKPISLGELPVSVDLYSSLGEPSVRTSNAQFSFFLSNFIIQATKPRDEDEEEDNEEPNFWQGNRNRRLWKITCTKAALNVKTVFFSH